MTGPGLWYWSSVDLKGVPPEGLGAFSRTPEPTAVPLIRSVASSSAAARLRARILQATTPIAPIRMAPPTPTTTPIMIFFWLESRPESESPEDPLKPGDSVDSLASLFVLVYVVGTGVPSIVWVVVMVVTVGVRVVELSSSEELVLVVVGSESVLDEVVVVSVSLVVVVVGSDVEVDEDDVVVLELVSSSDELVELDVVVGSVVVVLEDSEVVVSVSESVSVAEVWVGVGRASVTSEMESVTCVL